MTYYQFQINETATFMVGGIFTAQRGWKHNPRYHRGDYELIICTKGPLYVKLATEEYTLNANDILLVPPYTLMSGTRLSPGNVEFYWLHFILPKDTRVFKDADLPALINHQQTTERIIIPQEIKLTNLDHLIVLSHQLLSTNLQNSYDRKIADHFITMVLIDISKSALSQLNKRTPDVERISRLKEWIRTNLYRSPTVVDMANEAQLNPQYLSRIFKKITGIPPKKYQLELKLKTAQALLVKTSLSIKEVATNAYFENEKLFLRQFKQFCGVTPSEYRAQFDGVYHNNQVISPVLPIPEEITKQLTDIPDFGKTPNNSANS